MHPEAYSNSPLGMTIINSHKISIRLEVYTGIGGQLMYDSGNTNIPGGILDGQVDIQNEAIRRRFSMQFTDPTGALRPAEASAIFTTYGREVRIYRGVYTRYYGLIEIPLGVFGIANVALDDTGSSMTISLDGYDRADRVSRSKLIQDYSIPFNTYFTDAIGQLVGSQVPGLTYNFVSTTYKTPALNFQTGQDPWEAAQKMAAAIGCELFFDYNGVLVLQLVPDYSTIEPVWSYSEGQVSTLLNINKRQTNRDTFNYYIVTGENSSNTTPVRGEAFDDNPASPTYYQGPYGIVPAAPVSSKMVTATDQANQVARAMLQNTIGQYERLHFNAIVNPGHDTGDVIQVVRGRSKINARYVLDAISIPLTHNRAMDVTTRARQSAA